MWRPCASRTPIDFHVAPPLFLVADSIGGQRRWGASEEANCRDFDRGSRVNRLVLVRGRSPSRRSARVLFAPPRRVRLLGASNDVLRRRAKPNLHVLMPPTSGLARGQT